MKKIIFFLALASVVFGCTSVRQVQAVETPVPVVKNVYSVGPLKLVPAEPGYINLRFELSRTVTTTAKNLLVTVNYENQNKVTPVDSKNGYAYFKEGQSSTSFELKGMPSTIVPIRVLIYEQYRYASFSLEKSAPAK